MGFEDQKPSDEAAHARKRVRAATYYERAREALEDRFVGHPVDVWVVPVEAPLVIFRNRELCVDNSTGWHLKEDVVTAPLGSDMKAVQMGVDVNGSPVQHPKF